MFTKIALCWLFLKAFECVSGLGSNCKTFVDVAKELNPQGYPLSWKRYRYWL